TAIERAMPGERTFYAGVKRLFGTQMIRINARDGSFRIVQLADCSTGAEYRSLSIEGALDRYALEVERVFGSLAQVGSIGVLGTGGLDSRTVLAGLLSRRVTPQLMYGVGNSGLTDSAVEDLDIVNAIGTRFNVPVRRLDWSGD